MSRKSVLLTVGTVLLLAMMMVIPAMAASVDPIVVDGNPTCVGLGYDFGFKPQPEPPPSGDYSIDGINTVTIDSDGKYFDWTSTLGIDAVIVKGGPQANVYQYDPPAESFGDTDLNSPVNASGDPANISHIEFCYDYELTATKTANTEYTRTYSWDIDKEFDGEYSKFIGDAVTTHGYTVSVDQTVADSDFIVKGTITVNNPTPFNVGFSVTDMVDGVAATVTCPVDTLAPGASTVCEYSADMGDTKPADGLNAATVTSANPDVQGATAEKAYAFGAPTNVVGYKDINVTDTNGQDWQASGDDSWDYTKDFTCPTDPSQYVDGYYKIVHDNTAMITETGQSDDATVTVHCYAPVVSKDAFTSFNRDWTWAIEKSGNQTDLTLSTGQTFPVNYDVVVTAMPTDSAFKVYGAITVVNPNPNAAMTVALTDVLSSGQAAMITYDAANCDYAGGNLTIPKGGTAMCAYEAGPADGDPGTNTATATLNGIGFEGKADYAFGAPNVETDECIDVTDDQYGDLGTVCANESPKTIEYSMNVGPYDTCGEYEFVNMASFVTNDTGATGNSSWTVNINVPCGGGCTLTQGYWKTHSQEGPAPYDDAWQNLGPLEEDTPFYLSGKTWYEVFWTAPAGNAYYNLAHQYMAAKLNVLNGAASTPEVTAALTSVDTLFNTYTPAQVAAMKANNAVRKQFIGLASLLDNYNNGYIGPGHCSESNTAMVAAKTAMESVRISLIANHWKVAAGPRVTFGILFRNLQ